MCNEDGLAGGQTQDKSLMPAAFGVIRQNFRDDTLAGYLSAALLCAEYTPRRRSSSAGKTSKREWTTSLA